jgi:HD-like signal output (HDOD) protein
MQPIPFHLPPSCEAQLKACSTLPSPPQIALQIIDMAKNPELDVEDVVRVILIDPALSTKILQLANSSFYGHQKKVKDLHKATMVIGFNGVLSLALSFSLAKSLRREQEDGLSQQWFWRRALINGSAGHALGEGCRIKELEALFMASFIQDIGMLALDQTDPTLYSGLDLNTLSHQQILAHEIEHFGIHHAMAGGWLLSQWNFPTELVAGVRFSDEPEHLPKDLENFVFYQCVAMAGLFADLCITQAKDEDIFEVSETFQQTMNLSPIAFMEIIKTVKRVIEEIGPLFDIANHGQEDFDSLLEKAKDLLVVQKTKMEEQVAILSGQNPS